jgi:hypothetical protein
MIAFAVVLVLALGGLAAAIISKGDSGRETATTPSVSTGTTTVQKTTTVTTATEPASVTIAPNVTLDSSGAPKPDQSDDQSDAETSTAEKTTSTP